jgi:Zn-dependent protease/CBS domain-containing protein
MKTFYRVTSFHGIPVRVHYTWIVVALLGGWIISGRVLAEELPALSWLAHLGSVLLILALGFGSVVLHELGHSIIARAYGIRPRTMTLYPFGGVPSQLDQRAGWVKAIAIAIAGPCVSLGLWLLLGLLSAIDGLAPVLVVVLGVTAQVNLVLGLVNLLPGLPLDGGRILRALAWQWTFSYAAASATARKGGQAISYGLIFFGAWLWISQDGGLIALLLILIGWMLREAGSLNQQRDLVDHMLHKLTAADIALPASIHVSPEATLRQVYAETLGGRSVHAPMAVIADERFLGLLTMPAMLDVPQGTWDERTVAQVMVPAESLPHVAADTPLSITIPHYASAQDGAVPVLPVISAGRLVGLIDERRMDAILELEDALALYGSQPESDAEPASHNTSLHSESGAA